MPLTAIKGSNIIKYEIQNALVCRYCFQWLKDVASQRAIPQNKKEKNYNFYYKKIMM